MPRYRRHVRDQKYRYYPWNVFLRFATKLVGGILDWTDAMLKNKKDWKADLTRHTNHFGTLSFDSFGRVLTKRVAASNDKNDRQTTRTLRFMQRYRHAQLSKKQFFWPAVVLNLNKITPGKSKRSRATRNNSRAFLFTLREERGSNTLNYIHNQQIDAHFFHFQC